MPAGVCSETWILDHPQTLIALQRAYLAAGSEIIYAPTFGANRVLLGHHDLQREVQALNRDLVQLGREAVGTSALLAGDMTTTGQPVTPGDDSAYETLLEIYREQAEALLEAGVDLFAVETMMGVTECMAAIEAIRSLCETPILCTLSVYSDGKCYFDGSAEEAAELLPGLGADAVGLNCSSGPDQMGTVVRMMKKAAPDTPIAAKPNAGLPTITETGEAVYHMDPEDFARHMRALKQDGASLLGGCCGTGCVYRSAPRTALSGFLSAQLFAQEVPHLRGRHSERKAEFAVEHLLGHAPAAQLGRVDAPAAGSLAVLLGMKRLAQAQKRNAVMPG